MKVLILGRNGQLGLLEAPVPIHAIAKTDDPTAVRRPRYSVLDTYIIPGFDYLLASSLL